MLVTSEPIIPRKLTRYSLSFVVSLLIALFVSGEAGLIFAQEEMLHLEPVAAWNAVFSGSEATYRFAIQGPQPHPTKASWSLTANDRTIARGEVEVQSKGGQSQLLIPLRFPDTRPGIRFPLQIHLEAMMGDKTVSLNEQIVLFPADPFTDQQRWLEELQIVLYDPVGKTADIFDQAKIPYQFLRTTAAIDENAGVIVIGEGVSLESDRGLAAELLQKASAGAKILLLAPSEGQIPIPGSSESQLKRPERISLRGPDVIADLDKQLAGRWAPGGKPELASFQFHVDRDLPVWRIASDEESWSWIELEYEESRGRLLLCGLGLMDRWEAGPGPRYLMVSFLKRLEGDSQAASSEK